MIIRPSRQRHSRTPRRNTAIGREHIELVRRLTHRDRWILSMLHEHRVLTTEHLAALAFPTVPKARRRMLLLHRYGVVDRFRPNRPAGSAPSHWILAPAGAAVIAAEIGVDARDLNYNHDRALAFAHSLQLAHTVGLNEWFISLGTAIRRDQDAGRLVAWWSETRCRALWGDLARPDGYGHYTRGGKHVEFFLEYDLSSENGNQVARKLGGYAELARTTGITTPVLLWTPTTARESGVRPTLLKAWADLPDPTAVPVATASADLLNPDTAAPSPGHRVWLPLDRAGTGRVELEGLPEAWPGLTRPSLDTGEDSDVTPTDPQAHLTPPPPGPYQQQEP